MTESSHRRASLFRARGAITNGAFAVLAALWLGGCAASAYLGQSINGQLELLSRAQPIETLLADPGSPPELRARLTQALAIRNFASRELKLPDNQSYRRYADLGRRYALWNVFATPELSVKLREWCFPVAGCVGYRGYFSEADAMRFAAELRQQGDDVYVGAVPAYSTLGYFNDPVLSTFVAYPEAELARLLFHELTHQVAYAADDSTFNESFAVAVEREGLRRYFAGAQPAAAAANAESGRHREEFAVLVTGARKRLQEIYAGLDSDQVKRIAKSEIVQQLRRDYAELKSRSLEGYARYDAWFAGEINNAKLASVGLYAVRVPSFEALLRRHGGDLASFYEEVKGLAKMSKADRDARLDAAGRMSSQAGGMRPGRPVAQAGSE